MLHVHASIITTETSVTVSFCQEIFLWLVINKNVLRQLFFCFMTLHRNFYILCKFQVYKVYTQQTLNVDSTLKIGWFLVVTLINWNSTLFQRKIIQHWIYDINSTLFQRKLVQRWIYNLFSTLLQLPYETKNQHYFNIQVQRWFNVESTLLCLLGSLTSEIH